ncbi:transposase InsO family protein [Bradyrhizobium sp. USDA 4502]
MQNGFVEGFNGQMRDELLNETLFFGLDDARTKLAACVADYNGETPHSSLQYLTPAAYAASLTATDVRLRNPEPTPPIARCFHRVARRTNPRDSNYR